MVRKGNHGLMDHHPFINELLIWDKSKKYRSMFQLTKKIRRTQYDLVVNIQRFGASGFMTGFSKAKTKIGFKKNPFSFKFDIKVEHEIGNGKHEIDRNNELIASFTEGPALKPKLYPSKDHFEAVNQYKENDYICIAPSSVWYTKAAPKEKWIELVNQSPEQIFVLGGPGDAELADEIMGQADNTNITNLCGKLNFLESVALMQDAKMNFVNDSGPMHMASSVNAPTTVFYCSTVPEFGFGPLSDNSKIIQVNDLSCKPCGLHGHKACPKGHFSCGYLLEIPNRLS